MPFQAGWPYAPGSNCLNKRSKFVPVEAQILSDPGA